MDKINRFIYRNSDPLFYHTSEGVAQYQKTLGMKNMILSRATVMLTQDEGCKLKPYLCPANKLSIGIGRNLDDTGIRPSEAKFMLENDIQDCDSDLCKIFPHQFHSFPEDIQLVLLNMRFQLGYSGFRKFKKMIQAFENKNYKEAIKQMKDSRWYRQVPNRANRLIKIVEGEI